MKAEEEGEILPKVAEGEKQQRRNSPY